MIKFSEIKVGDVLIVSGMSSYCLPEGTEVTVDANDDGELFIPCRVGNHYIDGQLNDDGFIVGFIRKE